MKECAAKKGIHGNGSQCEWIEAICRNEIVGALFFDVFHALAEAKNGQNKIDEVGEGVDGLSDEFVHISMLAEESTYVSFAIESFPDHVTVVDGVEYGDDGCEYDSSYYG